MKSVLVLTNSLNGLYNFRRELILELIKEGYEVIIAAPNDEKVNYFKQIGCILVDTPVNRRGTNPIKDFKLLLKYRKIVKVSKPTIVLSYTIKPNVYGGLVCRLLGVPYIANITGLGTAVENKGLLQTLTLFLYRHALKKANCVFNQNIENQEFLKSYNILKGNNRLIPGSGVNLNHFTPIDYPSGQKIEFLFIARIIKEKGIDQYLEAAEYIRGKYPNTTFHVLGKCENDYFDRLKDFEARGIILYHGKQEDVREFHKISHCTIHPTYYPEGMSNVLLESAACGRPVITTNRSGCREIVDEGKNGYFVKQQNTQDLISVIEKFLKLDYKSKWQMGLEGRRKVENEFDRKIVIDAYIGEIKKVGG